MYQGNFFLVFHILTTYLGSADLLGEAGVVLGVVFEWLYAATLVTCFVLSLGNRPQGSNRFYMTMVCFWVFIMIYLTFAAIFVTVKSIQAEIAQHDFTLGQIFSNAQFFTIIVSLASTYVMWFLAALIFFDPWHMFTCVSGFSSCCCSRFIADECLVHPIYFIDTDLHQRAQHLRLL